MLCVTTTAGTAGLIQQNYTSYRPLINKPLPVAPIADRLLPEHDAHALAVAERAGCGPVDAADHNSVYLSRDLERFEVGGPLLVDVRPRLGGFALREVLQHAVPHRLAVVVACVEIKILRRVHRVVL